MSMSGIIEQFGVAGTLLIVVFGVLVLVGLVRWLQDVPKGYLVLAALLIALVLFFGMMLARLHLKAIQTESKHAGAAISALVPLDVGGFLFC